MKYWKLIHKKLSHTLSKEEQRDMQKWMSSDPKHRRNFELSEKVWDLSKDYKSSYQPNIEQGVLRFKQRIAEESHSQQSKVRPLKPLARLLRVAAAVVILVGMAALLRNYMIDNSGWNSAVAIENQKHKLDLPDGSVVWINENSVLDFPNQFAPDSRKVKLQGEAFFEVAKDASRPFIIETARTKVEVLGTSFNVRAYGAENFTEVTVESGQVKFGAAAQAKSLLLEAYDKGVYDHQTGELSQNKSANLNESAWQSNKLRFNETKMRTVIADLERHFNVEIKVENSVILDCPYTSTLPGNDIETILEVMATTFQWQKKQVDEKTYQISGDSCKPD